MVYYSILKFIEKVIKMRHSYDSFNYWDGLISANNTIRAHMLMKKLPTPKSIYVHSLIFCKDRGLSNSWGYFPDVMALVGYIEYSFLQEAFYQWIYCKERPVSIIPSMSVENIISEGQKSKKITIEEALNMRRHLAMIQKCWKLPNDKVITHLREFIRDFNRTWAGDQTEFLYLKIFKTPAELGDFVINSSHLTNTEEGLKNKLGLTVEEWKEICSKADKDKAQGERFRKILLKDLTEVL